MTVSLIRTVAADCGHTESITETSTLSFRDEEQRICNGCAEEFRHAIENQPVCGDCVDPMFHYGDCLPLIGTLRLHDSAFPHLTNSDGYTMSWTLEPTNDDNFCLSCMSSYTTCEQCGNRTSDDDINFCQTCNAYYCNRWCCEVDHSDCNNVCTESCCIDNEGEGSMSISAALARPAVPGKIVRSTRAVGFEIERNSNYNVSAAARDIRQAGHLYESHGEHCGHEYVLLPARGANLETAITETFGILNTHGLTGNADCGAHFHIDCTDMNNSEVVRAVAALRIVENVLYAMTEVGGRVGARRTASWCRPTAQRFDSTILDNLTTSEDLSVESRQRYSSRISSLVSQNDRYCGINTEAHSEHQTIEIRLMDGCLDAERALRAAAIGAAVVDYAKSTTTGTLRALTNNPLSLLWRAARAGFLSGTTLEYVEGRFGAVRVEMAAEETRAQTARIAAETLRAAETAYYNSRQTVRQAYSADPIVVNAQTNFERVMAESQTVVDAIRAAYDAAMEAHYRTERNAQTVRTAAIAERMAQRDAELSAAASLYDRAVRAEREVRQAVRGY